MTCFWNIKLVRLIVCVCVCVFGIIVLKITVERWFWELKMLIRFLIELHAWLHSCLCFSLLEKLVFSNFDTWLIYRALKLFLIAISTPSWQLGGSIEKVPKCLIAFQQLVDRLSFFNRVWWILPWHFSIAASVDALTLDTFLDTSRHLYLSSFTNLLYKGLAWFPSHFSRSLSWQIHPFTSQNTLLLQTSF